jgi:pilus assembly protein CpaE
VLRVHRPKVMDTVFVKKLLKEEEDLGKRTLTVLLIEDSPQYAHLVQRWLSDSAEGNGFLLNWTDSLAAGMSRLEKGGVDVILLDLGLPDCNGVETYAQTRARAPKTPILILSSAESEALALEMIQEGAEDYLLKSSCDAETLKRAVSYAIVRRKSQSNPAHAPSVPSRVIGVIGAKGGVGTTTLACNLASELRQQTAQKVLLADLDPDGGNVAFLTGIECKYSIMDAISNSQRLDVSCWEAIVAQAPDGLHIISSAGLPGETRPETGSLRDVLTFTQPLYPWSVLDLGRLNQESLALLNTVSDIFVVTTTTIPSLYSAKRVIEVLQTEAIESDRIRLVVNYAGEIQPWSRGELNNMFGVPIYATIPNDSKELHSAGVQKRLPGKHSSIRKAIAGLARKLTGLPEESRKSTLTSLVSLAERFRKPAEDAVVSQGGRSQS